MDDLSRIKGIGEVIATRLVAAGIVSFAALAAATPETIAAADVGGRAADYPGWIAEPAALKGPDPVPPVTAPPSAEPTPPVTPAPTPAPAPVPVPEPVPGPEAAAVESHGRVTITVIGPATGRRRGGFDFNATPRVILATPDQKALIEGDPSLAVTSGGTAPGAAAPADRLTPADFDFGESDTRDVTVLGPAKGRRRAGFEFGAAARTVSVNRDQLDVLLGDLSLAVAPA